MRSIASSGNRGNAVPFTTSFTFRNPAIACSGVAEGKSGPKISLCSRGAVVEVREDRAGDDRAEVERRVVVLAGDDPPVNDHVVRDRRRVAVLPAHGVRGRSVVENLLVLSGGVHESAPLA